MKKNKGFSLDLSILALAALTAIIVPASVALGAFCRASAPISTKVSSTVTASISADTLSTVSGTELPLRISIKNDGDTPIRDGSIIIGVVREPQAGDFSQGDAFVVTRAVVKTGVDLEPHSTNKLSFAWIIPAALPSGVYTAQAVFAQSGRTLENASAPENNPFGNDAKVFVKGEASSTVFFVASSLSDKKPNITLVNGTAQDVTLPVTIKTYNENMAGTLLGSESRTISLKSGASTAIAYSAPDSDKPFSVTVDTTYQGVPAFYLFTSSAPAPTAASWCFDRGWLYSWAMVLGGLGTLMVVLAHLKERRNRV